MTGMCHAGNIYTHLLPALTLLALLFMHALPVWEHAKWAFYESVIPTVICLSASVLYHALMANHRHYRKYLLIDVRPLRPEYTGAMIVGSASNRPQYTSRE